MVRLYEMANGLDPAIKSASIVTGHLLQLLLLESSVYLINSEQGELKAEPQLTALAATRVRSNDETRLPKASFKMTENVEGTPADKMFRPAAVRRELDAHAAAACVTM
jgi:hypothetical protein